MEKSLPEPQGAAAPETAAAVPNATSFAQRMFGDDGLVAAVARLSAYVLCGAFTVYFVMWLGASFFSDGNGVTRLWGEMYGEAAFVLGAVLPALLMARLEGREVGVYGLPRQQAFGKMFWMGAAWGLASLTVLILVLRGVHAFYFGAVVLHGARVLKFALFWGVYFVLVGIFEEFLFRGYAMYTLSRAMGFWPTAVVLSLAFAVVHWRNTGETWVGLLGVVAIGLFFCLTLHRTGSLWFGVGFHALWDWGQTYLYSVPDSGTMEAGHLLRPSFHGPDWLTGGTVGPEASVVCFVVIAAVSAVFARRYPGVRYGAGLSTNVRNSAGGKSLTTGDTGWHGG
jgi:membrane protease YdiL (CAAX protease family)